VCTVVPCREKTTITLDSGRTAWISAGAPSAPQLVAGADAARRTGEPIGVLLSKAGEVLDLAPAHVSTVAFVRQDEDHADRWLVGFWAFTTLCYLTHDHPDFERLKRILEAAAGTETRVVFANHSQPVEDEDEVWWRLLDVRLVDLTTANGAAAGGRSTFN
jgi:hypothetical protein